MTSKIACTFAVLSGLAASAQAQDTVPHPTKVDAAKVAEIIINDKTKIETYCKLTDLGDEIVIAGSAGDKGKIEQLVKQAADLGKALGPEFIRLTAGLEDMDLHSKEGEEVSAELDKLDKLCPPK